MKILLINGSPKGQRSNSLRLATSFIDGVRSEREESGETVTVEELHIASMNISSCKGCFACWQKTPGICCIKDDMQMVLDRIICSNLIVWSFPLYYFGVPGILKNLIDRQLPMKLPFMSSRTDGCGGGSHPSRYEIKGIKHVLTCPMGHELRYSRKRGKCIIYKDKEYCRACRNKCTSAEWKEVSFGPETDCVPVKMFGMLTEPVQKIPSKARISPSNHTLDTGHVPKKKVVLRIQDDKEKLKQRMCLSEHPFGTVKWYRGAYFLLCKGKAKAAAELGLSFLAYNMTRAINMVGVKALIGAM